MVSIPSLVPHTISLIYQRYGGRYGLLVIMSPLLQMPCVNRQEVLEISVGCPGVLQRKRKHPQIDDVYPETYQGLDLDYMCLKYLLGVLGGMAV